MSTSGTPAVPAIEEGHGVPSVSTVERRPPAADDSVGEIARAGTPAPEQTIDSVKADLAEIKEKAHR
ncbi:hypothetical protein ACVWXB_000999 [Streptomyces sp. TE12347]